MSALGQSRRFAPPPMTSGLPQEADTVTAGRHVSKVPNSEMARGVKSRYTANEGTFFTRS